MRTFRWPQQTDRRKRCRFSQVVVGIGSGDRFARIGCAVAVEISVRDDDDFAGDAEQFDFRDLHAVGRRRVLHGGEGDAAGEVGGRVGESDFLMEERGVDGELLA